MASVTDIFERMPEMFNAAKAGGFDATVQFDLGGDNGGQWYVVIADGNVAVEKGQADEPSATIRMDAGDFTQMMSGKLDPMNAFMMGKVKVEGDLNTVMKFQTLFG
ncbi:MAG TPA: SCP2 sterol-binding domain-containing protein [Candidatus Sulfomarinibacteraceae bacterium]|nr:SCP2 sterol-binding domain-containing protein [Candidatus Sulfomarinibacteraceae bacterium]